jgi:hypothetical protein
MTSENIYDLSAIIGKNEDVEVKRQTISDGDIDTYLIGYTQVPNSEWKNLKYYDHIRYLRKDGSFRRGGYIKNIWLAPDEGKIRLELSSGTGYGSRSWNLGLQSVEKIWRKDGAAESATVDLTEINTKIENLEQVCANLTKEIVRMNNEQKRVLTIIKKINDKFQSR